MFPKPRPAALITVPSCSSCNSSFSKDDEYLRDVLSFREELSDNPFVKQLNKTVPRRFARSQSQGYFNYLHACIGEETVKTKSGIYWGSKTTFDVDILRIERVLGANSKRTLSSLHWEQIDGRVRRFSIHAGVLFES